VINEMLRKEIIFLITGVILIVLILFKLNFELKNTNYLLGKRDFHDADLGGRLFVLEEKIELIYKKSKANISGEKCSNKLHSSKIKLKEASYLIGKSERIFSKNKNTKNYLTKIKSAKKSIWDISTKDKQYKNKIQSIMPEIDMLINSINNKKTVISAENLLNKIDVIVDGMK